MKKEIDIEELSSLKDKIQSKKALIGAETVLKELRAGRLKKILLASNCPAKVKTDVLSYAKLSSVPVIDLVQNNEELGILCKKNFLVAVVGLREE